MAMEKCIIECLPYAIIIHDMTGRIVDANAASQVLLGINAAETLGEYAEYLTKAEGEQLVEQGVASGLEGEHGVFEYPCYNPKLGHIVWLKSTYSPIWDDAGSQIGVTRFESDITRRKQMISEIRALKIN